jgi:DNA-directed RNA polymerase specialized sigma24 family protein
VGATRRAGDMPDTVIDLLEREWEVLRTSPGLAQALRRWGSEDEVLAQFPTIDALVAFVHARGRPARQREDVLAALACRAGADELAGQVLLQLLLPGCKSLVAAFGWLGDSPGERAADVVGDVWARIRALAPTRPQWVAFPLLSAARSQLHRRARRATRETPSDVTEHLTASQVLAAEPEPSAAEELAEILREAHDDGVLSAEQAELIWSYRVQRVSPAESARCRGATPAAVERRRLRAELRLRTHAVAACA